MILQWGSAKKVSIELPVSTRHSRVVIEKLLKANKQQQHLYVWTLFCSGASMYNFNDEEEEDDGPTKEKAEENEQLKEKMKQVRLKMEKLNISKKVIFYFYYYNNPMNWDRLNLHQAAPWRTVVH